MFVRQGSGLSPVAGVSSHCSVCSLALLSALACLWQITHTQEQMGADLSTHKYTKHGQASRMYWIYSGIYVLGNCVHKTCLFFHVCFHVRYLHCVYQSLCVCVSYLNTLAGKRSNPAAQRGVCASSTSHTRLDLNQG